MADVVPAHLGIFHDPVKVVDGDDPEPGYPSPTLQTVLAEHSPDILVSVITLSDILGGCLASVERGFTVLCVPGGFAPNYASRLGSHGIKLIREFVSNGGGFVGICAGAYLGSSACLSLLPVECLDMHRWNRGTGPCQIRYTREGGRALGAPTPPSLSEGSTPAVIDDEDEGKDEGEDECTFSSCPRDVSISDLATITVRYANGPLMRIGGCGSAASYAEFATEFRGLGHAGTRDGSRLEGSPAIIVGRSGATGGVVALCSPHLEDGTDEARVLLPLVNLVRLTSRDSFYQQWVLQQGLGLESCSTPWTPPWSSASAGGFGGGACGCEVTWLSSPAKGNTGACSGHVHT